MATVKAIKSARHEGTIHKRRNATGQLNHQRECVIHADTAYGCQGPRDAYSAHRWLCTLRGIDYPSGQRFNVCPEPHALGGLHPARNDSVALLRTSHGSCVQVHEQRHGSAYQRGVLADEHGRDYPPDRQSEKRCGVVLRADYPLPNGTTSQLPALQLPAIGD